MNLQTLKTAHSIYKEYVRETAVKLPLYGPSWPRALALVVFCFLSETIYQSVSLVRDQTSDAKMAYIFPHINQSLKVLGRLTYCAMIPDTPTP